MIMQSTGKYEVVSLRLCVKIYKVIWRGKKIKNLYVLTARIFAGESELGVFLKVLGTMTRAAYPNYTFC